MRHPRVTYTRRHTGRHVIGMCRKDMLCLLVLIRIAVRGGKLRNRHVLDFSRRLIDSVIKSQAARKSGPPQSAIRNPYL